MIPIRSSGVLLHLSSLPGPYGIGSMGEAAFRFVDFLQDAGQRYWQVLPLVPPGGGYSPYQSHSSIAGNPFLIDLDKLHADALLTEEELRSARHEATDQVDFDFLAKTRMSLLYIAFSRCTPELADAVSAFTIAQKSWLPDYALFAALQDHFDGAALSSWPDQAIVRRTPAAINRYCRLLAEQIQFHCFLQYLFFTQWQALKNYANDRDISIIGDLPFYLSADSADVWVNPSLFRVDGKRAPRYFSGVPADSFSPAGQHWGMPLYAWKNHEKEDFAFWKQRILNALSQFDLLRIDHFRAIHSFWEIPADAETAADGRWKKGPGQKLLDVFFSVGTKDRFLAEDLGDLSEAAHSFVAGSGLPTMAVLTDAFTPAYDNAFLPHNVTPDTVYYTSTHDTPTFYQFLTEQADDASRAFATDYLRLQESEGYTWGAIAGAFASPARLVICPLQDILSLGSDARMNTPGTVGFPNWAWRVRGEALNAAVSSHLRHLTLVYRRMQ
ncbi:MAG: 4-alpha-glucanotransferase [Oscillospiraceae bacterium]|jgi:4-alpha-glucanotransferase